MGVSICNNWSYHEIMWSHREADAVPSNHSCVLVQSSTSWLQKPKVLVPNLGPCGSSNFGETKSKLNTSPVSSLHLLWRICTKDHHWGGAGPAAGFQLRPQNNAKAPVRENGWSFFGGDACVYLTEWCLVNRCVMMCVWWYPTKNHHKDWAVRPLLTDLRIAHWSRWWPRLQWTSSTETARLLAWPKLEVG